MSKETVFPDVSYEQWKEEAERSLKGKPIEKLFTNTYEGITLKPIYTRKDLMERGYKEEVPGFPSYKRGQSVLGYKEKAWHNAQELYAESSSEFNEETRSALQKGQTMIHFKAEKLAGAGIMNTVDEMEAAFKGISPSVPVLVDTGECSLPFLAEFLGYLLKNNFSTSMLQGTIGMDPLGTLAAKGSLSGNLERLYDWMAEVTQWSEEYATNVRTILVKSDVYHEGGASAVQELAFAIATAKEYLEACLDRGLSIDMAAPKFLFSFSVGASLFMEMAKLRAARVLWSNVVAAYGGREEAQKMNIHARTSAYTKTVYDPYTNILRSTTEAFAAVAGGVESLHVSPFDEPIRQGDAFSGRIARNTQSILKDEALMDKVIDPAGGSWYVEAITDELTQQAWSLFQKIESFGGMTAALKHGFVQEEIAKVEASRKHRIQERKDRIVGTNFYVNLKEKPLEQNTGGAGLNKPFTEMEKPQAVQPLREVWKSDKQGIMDTAVQAAMAGAAYLEISKALRNEDSSLTIKHIPASRASLDFESLRKASEQYKAETGHAPAIGLVNLDSLALHKARADFISGFFQAGGFDVISSPGAHSIDDAVNAAVAGKQLVLVICGTDERYKEWAAPIVEGIKMASPSVKVMLAGKPDAALEQVLSEAGIDGFIHINTNCYQILSQLQKEMGVVRNED